MVIAVDEGSTVRDQPRAGRRGIMRRVPTTVLVLALLHGALMLAYTVLYPPYVSFDEPQHVDMVFSIANDQSYPPPAGRETALGVARSSDFFYGSERTRAPYLAVDATPRRDRQSLAQLGGDEPAPTPPRYPNQMTQHPPGYYAVSALVVSVLPVDQWWDYDRVVWFLRFLSVLMMLPLPVLLWAAARVLVGPGRTAEAAAALPLLVPGLTRLGGSVNNDVLVVVLAAALAVPLAKVVGGDLSRRTAVVTGLVVAAGLLVKGTFLPLLPGVVAVYLVGWWRAGGAFPWRPALALTATSALGGWWWVRNVLVFGTVQPNGFGPEATARIGAAAEPGPRTVELFLVQFGQVEDRFWSALGMIDSPTLPFEVIRGLSLLVLLAVAVAVLRGIGSPKGRVAVLALLVPVVTAFALLALTTYTNYRDTGLPAGIQGRYLYPGSVLAAAAVLAAVGRSLGRAARVLPLLVLGLGLVVQIVAARVILLGLWLPTPAPGATKLDNLRLALTNVSAWSPWPVGLTAVPFVLSVGLAVLALVVVGRQLRQH